MRPFSTAFARLLQQVLPLLFPALMVLCVGVGDAHAQQVPAGFSDASVIGGLEEPVGFTFDANGRMYVWEKRGMVWIVENGVRLATPLIDIREEVGNWRDHGCLGFALDPDFLSNGRIYLMYAVDRHHLMNFGTPAYSPGTDAYYNATIVRICRYVAPGPLHNTADPLSRTVLLGETRKTGAIITHESHSSGSLVFGSDGTLLAGIGDGASYNNADGGGDTDTYYAQALLDSIMRPKENIGAFRAQLVDCLNGKVLRIDPNTGDGVPGNPFYDVADPRAPRSRVWAMGLRNPYRMTLRPGTGSTDPSDGEPGTLYIGDVGWGQWEDLNVCDAPGLNFGWPMFEGLEPRTEYMQLRVANMDAPNPLFAPGGCNARYFDFQDLLKQDTPVHQGGHPNPCDPSQQVPPNIPHFFHHRPAVDWAHFQVRARTGVFNGNAAATVDLNDAASPVQGPAFQGNASVGGTWITGLGWPLGYQNMYFHGDYGGAWIKRFEFDGEDAPVAVQDFGALMGAVVFLREGPDGALWYVRYETGEVRKVSPIGVTNLPPIPMATPAVRYGPGPLTVQFDGTGSSDPEEGALIYTWDFGGLGSSTSATPSFTFTAPPGVPTSYTVQLTVTDPEGASASTTVLVSVNNTPPLAAITSFPEGQLYPPGVDTTFSLTAEVSDAEHSAAQLSYRWRTYLHHNDHVHPESAIQTPTGTTVVSGEGCYTDNYHYEVELIVTDAGGLSTRVSRDLYPRCTRIPPTAVITTDRSEGDGPFQAHLSGTASLDNGTIVDYAWDFGDGTTDTGVDVTKVFTDPGAYYVTLTATDNDGNVGRTTRVITVYDPLPPRCLGPAGGLLREYWTGINPDPHVTDLTREPTYPDSPRSSDIITNFQGPSGWADRYGTRVRGYIIAPADDDYVFTVTGDDAVTFYLSPNADPSNMQAVCSTPAWTGQTELDKYPSQRSVPIHLKAGRYYYVELLHKEGFGGDHFAVWWQWSGAPDPAIVPGDALAVWSECTPALELRAVLQGAEGPTPGLMRDDLRVQGLLPLSEPYTGLGFTHQGTGGQETLDPQLLTVSGKNAIVDWVFVELRDASAPATVVATRSALLQRDGDIISADGRPELTFLVREGDYHVAVRHRNHLGVLSQNTVFLSKTGGAVLDLSSGLTPAYGTGARAAVGQDRWGLWCGDVLHDGVLRYTGGENDRDPILVDIGGMVPTAVTEGYLSTDVNLDGRIKYTGVDNDRDPILVNVGGTIPTATRAEQFP